MHEWFRLGIINPSPWCGLRWAGCLQWRSAISESFQRSRDLFLETFYHLTDFTLYVWTGLLEKSVTHIAVVQSEFFPASKLGTSPCAIHPWTHSWAIRLKDDTVIFSDIFPTYYYHNKQESHSETKEHDGTRGRWDAHSSMRSGCVFSLCSKTYFLCTLLLWVFSAVYSSFV